MKFKHGTRRRALEYEKDWAEKWKADRTFEKSVEQRPKDNAFVFYDGPPFISGVPHHGTLLSSIVKDAIPRYQTMKGKRVERVWGWDAHGLPAERYSEKKLGLKSRQDVLDYGLEKYIVATRDYMNQTAADWEQVIDRVGRWVDFKGAYKTMDKNYMESVWWAFKTLYEKGKIYEGEKVLMYCTLDGTPLSKAEVTMDAGAYQDVTDPSVYVKFRLKKTKPLKAIIIHGNGGGTKDDSWQPWLEKQLTNLGVDVINETFPDNDLARAKYWIPHLEKLGADENTILIGHSSGAVAAMRYAENHKIKGSFLVAPCYTDLDDEDEKASGYYDSPWRWNDIKHNQQFIVQFASLDDPYISINEARHINKKLESDYVEERSYGHFGVAELPILLEKIKPIVQGSEQTLLAWTTTPWTLPANTALAINEDLEYVEVEVGEERFVLAKELLGKVLQNEKHQPLEYKIVSTMKGADLVGREYEPLFDDRGEGAHKVWSAPYVSHEDGTGIVHLAPAYGEEDFILAQEKGIPVVHTIDQNGFFTEGDWVGQNVWEINKTIAKELHARSVVWKVDYICHSYPHCHRCGTKLMYRALPSWFVDIFGQKEQMLEQNESINWFPTHLKHGRFAKNIEQAPDWNISRDRFWATPLPVWRSESGKIKVVGSYAELEELSGQTLDDYHRPWIDDVKFTIDGEEYTRIDKVMDSWFEAGSMPFAQFHYPFENKEKFEANFPGDFIVEYVGQVRAWFYYMHAMSVALFGTSSFKNVITTGTLAGNDGRKMSKSYGNYTDPEELMDQFSADSLRFLLLGSPVLNGEDFALHEKDVGDVARKLGMIWNMYDFFTMYAEVDGWEFDGELQDPLSELHNPLDIWIVSRVHQLVTEFEKHLDGYNLPDALSPILPFLDDASNWYVRRSRRRFWKSEETSDKADAYRTLHYVLVRLSYVLAPLTPFLAEELYRNLTGDDESIHLKDWLPAGKIDEAVTSEMNLVRDYVNQGLSVRAKSGMKVRQPLASVTVPYTGAEFDFTPILLDELNVKSVEIGDEVTLDLELTPELKREGLMREVIRHVQSARKKAGLNIDDRIVLQLTTDDEELQQAITEHDDTIASEALAQMGEADENPVAVKIDQKELKICLKMQ